MSVTGGERRGRGGKAERGDAYDGNDAQR